MRRARSLVIALLASFTLLAAACGGDDTASDAAGGAGGAISGDLLVFAAASLTDAFGELATAFAAANPGVDVQLNLAGSSSLREQILAGAPAGVFASANPATMAAIVDAGAVGDDPQVFATNRLEIAVPAGNPGDVRSLADFADDDLLIGLCIETVPCGEFGRQALANAEVEPSIDTDEADVRSLLTKIEADELDAGIVYVTDVLAAGDRVEGIEIPAGDNVTASYPIAALAEAPNPRAADAFVAFVVSAEGQAILTDFGFGT